MPEGQEPTATKPNDEKPEGDKNEKPGTGQEPAGGKKPEEKEPTGFDALPKETQDEIKRLRAEAAGNRKEAQEAKAKVEEYENANATEKEKAEKRADKAEK